FSKALGQGSEKTQKALKSTVPTILLGIADRAETKEGVDDIVKLVHKDGLDEREIPDYANENYDLVGKDALDKIFGSDLGRVASNLNTATGIGISQINKLMEITTPLLMGLIGKKMRREAMTNDELM